MIKVGTTSIDKVYVGSNEVTKAYIGTNIIYESNPSLPYDAQVEYLQTTGTQYINTGISPSSITPIIEARMYEPSVTSNFYVFGADASGNTRFSFAFLTSNRIEFRMGNYVPVASSIGWHTIKMDGSNGDYFIDDEKKGNSTYRTFSSTNPLLIFTSYGADNAIRAIVNGARISSYKLYDGTNLLQDMISVRVGQVGYMYDRVSNTLFGNAGTGDFVIGNDIN